MTKQITQLDLILEIVGRFPSGASVEEILLGLHPPPPRRTLQYQLASLVKSGRLIAEGRTKRRRFHLPAIIKKSVTEQFDGRFSLSTIAKSINLTVSRPIQERTYVSYSREFLDRYRPNITQYFSEPLKRKLFALGTTDGDRPAGIYARQMYSRLLIDLSWNSSRLEGNTYSLLETERLLELGEAAEGKGQRETQLISEYLKDSRIKMKFLPPYSPNLHLIERLWQFMNRKVRNNQYYEKFTEFKEAIFLFFENISQHKEELKSLVSATCSASINQRMFSTDHRYS